MPGGAWSAIAETFPGKPTWDVKEIPDLTGKVVIVTGGNAGVGRETVKALLQHNAKVYLAARSEERAQEAITALKTDTGKEAIFLKLDLADLVKVKAAAEEFLSKEEQLHILFLNAGVMACPVDWTTKQGYDMQFGTNVIGHFYFTQLLLPALLAVKAASPTQEKARVVTTSSSAGYLIKDIFWDAIVDGPARRKLEPYPLYHSSKLGNMVVARELASRYGDSIVSTCVNPGNLKTELQQHLPWIQVQVFKLVMHEASRGALTQLRAGTSPEGADWNGQFLKPWGRLGKANPKAEDPAVGKRLWALLEAETSKY
ncbi:NAD(P)-binding protein [Auriscalpium vulgare]|uniref:NAD(P)-binding protein n=1 Tax=Auriscalpium vulgare TaxID=40419 RepID=A0ACB8S810_9AGAM|nr:NAD(P)-binding protein [Auriscalpium vulgare]